MSSNSVTDDRRRGDDRHGEVKARHRRLSEHAGGRLAVLILERRLYVLNGKAEVGEFVGLHEYLHRVVSAADVAYAAHAGHAAQQVEHVEGGVVTEVYLVILRVGRHQGDCHQLVGCFLFHADAVLHHLGGQARLCFLHAVLYVDSRQFGVDVHVECHQSRESA